MKYRIENWTSSEGRTETHYFRLKDDEYLFGFNPLITPPHIMVHLYNWAEQHCEENEVN